MNAYEVLLYALLFSASAIPQSRAQNSADGRIERALHGLRPPIAIKGRPAVRWTMAERMAAHHVPGASIAIIDGGGHKVDIPIEEINVLSLNHEPCPSIDPRAPVAKIGNDRVGGVIEAKCNRADVCNI